MSAYLEIERRLTLSPERCFGLWTDPGEVRRWWGPKDRNGVPFEAHTVDWDVRTGATWRIGMVAPDGTRFWQSGEMIEVNPPNLLRFTFHWVENGRRGPTTEISVRFVPEGSGTRMLFVQSGFADTEIRDGHSDGWNECLDRLVHAVLRHQGKAA